ncbi:MAG: HK97 gp10 family phage protein [Herbinix sp.]|nr:HK97 gp10 family phage protein [Herbinix sp.]
MAKKPVFTFESNLDKITDKIQEVPEKVLNVIGQNIVKEVKLNVPKRTGRLKKSLGYWARKYEKDLQIGFKIFYAPFVFNHDDPIKPVVVKNAQLIADMIKKAIDEIGKKGEN